MYNITTRRQVVNEYSNGESVKNISKKFGVSRSCIYKWIYLYLPRTYKIKDQIIEFSAAEFLNLKKKLERAEREKSILKETYTILNLSLKQKLQIAEQLKDKYATKEMCRMLDIHTATFYNHDRRRVKETIYMKNDAQNKDIIIDIYNKSNGRFGSKKIFEKMKSMGISISLQKVSYLMKELNLKSKRRNTPIRQKPTITNYYCKNKLKQEFNQPYPNCFWVGDVTCIIVNNNKFYICVIMDLFSRKIISYNISSRNNDNLTVNTFKAAFELRNRPQKLDFSQQPRLKLYF